MLWLLALLLLEQLMLTQWRGKQSEKLVQPEIALMWARTLEQKTYPHGRRRQRRLATSHSPVFVPPPTIPAMSTACSRERVIAHARFTCIYSSRRIYTEHTYIALGVNTSCRAARVTHRIASTAIVKFEIIIIWHVNRSASACMCLFASMQVFCSVCGCRRLFARLLQTIERDYIICCSIVVDTIYK